MLNHLIALFRYETLYKMDLCARDCFYYLKIKHFNLRKILSFSDMLVAKESVIASNMTKHRACTGSTMILSTSTALNTYSELAFRDVVNLSKLYDQQMTLLIGLHYFYINTLRISTVL